MYPVAEKGDVALEVKNLSSTGTFRNVSFAVRKGEILGFAGLVGAGRSELVNAVFGKDPKLAGEVYVNGERASMTPKEYDLLFYLVKNKNIALSRDKLLEEVWGYDFFGDDRTVDTHIKMLRNSLGEYRKFIVTLRGMGYKFEAN